MGAKRAPQQPGTKEPKWILSTSGLVQNSQIEGIEFSMNDDELDATKNAIFDQRDGEG